MKESRWLYVIAESHLGAREGDLEAMISFLSSLDPEQSEILFLGDLFHIWAGPAKFHTDSVRQLLGFLHDFRSRAGRVYLMTGNRDVFFPEVPGRRKDWGLPFDRIATEALVLEKAGGKLMAVHGDTVNSRDINYLRWRNMVRSPLFRLPFRLMPARIARKIMFSLESKLKQTNLAFRKDFPEEEWLKFLEHIQLLSSPDLLLCGHFHPETLICNQVEQTTGLILPDWCDSRFYLLIDENLAFREKKFTSN